MMRKELLLNNSRLAIIKKLKKGDNEKIIWINLRREPIVYINGFPYAARYESLTLIGQNLCYLDSDWQES